jgi:hypothetical protein
VAADLRAAGFDARKVPGSGAAVGYPGDVVINGESTGTWLLQCKNSKEQRGRAAVTALLREVVIGRVDMSGTELIAMRRAQFIALVRGVAPRPINWPRIVVQAKEPLEHLEGHDALVFRRTGQREWMAIVRREKFDAIK